MKHWILIVTASLILGALPLASRRPVVVEPALTVDDITRSIEVNPSDDHAYEFRAAMLRDLGDYVRALKDIDKAIELNPRNEYCYVTKASILCKLGRKSEAPKLCDQLIQQSPSASGFLRCGWIHVLADDYRGAIAAYDEGIRRDPNDYLLYQFRGSAKDSLGDWKGSFLDHSKGIALDKNATQFQRIVGEGLRVFAAF